jgi:hypothetical protein
MQEAAEAEAALHDDHDAYTGDDLDNPPFTFPDSSNEDDAVHM